MEHKVAYPSECKFTRLINYSLLELVVVRLANLIHGAIHAQVALLDPYGFVTSVPILVAIPTSRALMSDMGAVMESIKDSISLGASSAALDSWATGDCF